MATLITEKVDRQLANKNYYVTTENILPNREGIKFPAQSFTTSKKVNIYQYNDILISNIRPYFKKIWLANHNGTRSGDVLDFRSKNESKLLQEYLYVVLQSDKFFNYVTATSKGTKMPRGDKQAIMDYKFDLPSVEKQKEKSHYILILEKKIQLNNQINANLLKLT